MIGMLKGRVESVDTSNAVVDVHGVGFELRMPSNDLTAMHMGQDVKIYTSMSVSQDAITLFGFLDARSKRMFLQLQKVSGVGTEGGAFASEHAGPRRPCTGNPRR